MWITSKVSIRPSFASDACKPLISLFKALQNGWVPPSTLTKSEYYSIKEKMDLEDPLTAFAGFGCSFAGKWFGGYASSEGRNYCLNAKNSLLNKVSGLNGIVIEHKDYREVNPTNALIYCDPPYENTTAYGAIGSFNSSEFWAKVKEWSIDNTVLVSEYQAPLDFEVVWSAKVKTDIRGKDNKKLDRVEKLFEFCV